MNYKGISGHISRNPLFQLKLRNSFGFFKLFCNKTRATNVIIYITSFYAKWGKICKREEKE